MLILVVRSFSFYTTGSLCLPVLPTSSLLVFPFSFTITTLLGLDMQSLILSTAQLVESTSFFPWELCQESPNLPWLVQKPFSWSALRENTKLQLAHMAEWDFTVRFCGCVKIPEPCPCPSFQRVKKASTFCSIFTMDAAVVAILVSACKICYLR